MRVCICATQVPFAHGGAEIHVESLHRELLRRGFEAEIVTLPFSSTTRLGLLKSSLAWRLIDLQSGDGGSQIDLVIATRFPSYLVRHPNKVVWLIHQFRSAYDLLGTRFGGLTDGPEDRRVIEMIRRMDNRTLREARGLFTNARNTANRLKRFNDLDAEPLYPPPKLDGSYRCGEFGDYVFAPGRLNLIKRIDLLIRAMKHTRSGARCLISGSGPDRGELEGLIAALGLQERVKLLGWVSDEQLLELYSGCFAVYFAPYDEDYGYITIEAFKSGKPVLTAEDSGGVLEFVTDGESGYVCPDSPRRFAERIDELFADRERAREMGRAGGARVGEINWERVMQALTGRTHA